MAGRDPATELIENESFCIKTKKLNCYCEIEL